MLQIDTGLLELLPDFYKPILDYQQILSAEEAELEELAGYISQVHDNVYVQTMDEDTAYEWEQLLGIQTEPDATLETRRARVLNRLTTNPPFTLDFLYEKLDELVGPGKWEVTVDYGNYTIYVDMAAEDQAGSIEISYTVQRIKPAHIVYIVRPLLAATVLESEQVSTSGVTHNYKLGTWSLGAKPFDTTFSEVTYKMANVSSIQSRLLGDIASAVSTDVAKARINGSIVITSLTKSTSNGVTTITYSFLQSQASSITKIELLDSSNNVLTSANVYIPVASDLSIKHTLTAKEGV